MAIIEADNELLKDPSGLLLPQLAMGIALCYILEEVAAWCKFHRNGEVRWRQKDLGVAPLRHGACK